MKRIFLVMLCSLLGALFGCSGKSRFQSVDVEQFARELQRKEMQLVDVRTPAEYAEGHIDGALNFDVQGEAFDAQLSTLDPKRPVALYCRSGRRSKVAAERVAKAGFTVVELDRGYLSWQAFYDKQ